MNDKNMELYTRFRSVPAEAKKKIQGGRLNGFTDINPMWRIKTLTEQFGPCGFGWYYTLDKQWLEEGADGVISAFVNITLYVKRESEWSAGIRGTGGSMFVAKESRGLYTDDEAYKKALTDAIGVAAKALGIGADVYFEKDASKYDTKPPESKPTSAPQENGVPKRSTRMTSLMEKKGLSSDEMKAEVEKLLFKGVIKTMDVTAMTDVDFNAYLKTLDRHIQQVN